VNRVGIDLPPADQGWRSSSIEHNAGNNVLFLGRTDNRLYRGFIVFDPERLQDSPVNGNVSSASLRITQDLFSSDDNAETVTVRAFSGDVASLVAAGANPAMYDALGAGTIVGNGSVTEANIAQVLEINFNAAGVTLIDNAQSNIAFGLEISSANNNQTSEYVRFGTSLNGTWLRVNGGP
jgi:hypothetical protein